jgi:hypothetical protein
MALWMIKKMDVTMNEACTLLVVAAWLFFSAVGWIPCQFLLCLAEVVVSVEPDSDTM